MTTKDDIAALLDDVADQIDGPLIELHDDALARSAARSRFRARVKSVLEQLRSVLDYFAVGVTNQYGTPKGLIYYPLAQSETDFAPTMDGKMPGVAVARPDIADAIRKWQPFQPGLEWMRQLNQLAREQKHNRLSLQMIRGTTRCRVTEVATGAYVEWVGLTFRPGRTPGSALIESQGGTIAPRPEVGRPSDAPQPFWVGVGPTGIEVFGVPIDYQTQLPLPSPALNIESEQVDRWFFLNPHIAVLEFLRTCDNEIRRALNDIAHVAGL